MGSATRSGSALSASERLADFSLSLEFDEIPSSVVTAAKLHILDTIGCGIAAHALGVGTAGCAVATDAASDGATVIGQSTRTSARDAALGNGMLCHALDFDDTHAASICHIGTVVTPALVAVAEDRGRAGRDLLTAVVVGSEIIARLGAAAAPEYMIRGFHPTSVCGVFGAAAGAARLIGLERLKTAAALGIAGSMASGIFAYLADGAATKPIHAGIAAANGVLAAELAEVGAAGPATVFEDRFGVFAAYYEGRYPAFNERLSDLREVWETEKTAFKAYPSCHFTHGCLDAASTIHHLSRWDADNIASVIVAIPDAGIPLVVEPIAAKRQPKTDYDGKFSLPYSVAAMLVHGRVDIDTYRQEALFDEVVAELAHRVDYEHRDFPTFPQAFPGWVKVTHVDGTVLEREIPYQEGANENPLSQAGVVAKFRQNVALGLDPQAAESIGRAILSLEDVNQLTEITSWLASAAAMDV